MEHENDLPANDLQANDSQIMDDVILHGSQKNYSVNVDTQFQAKVRQTKSAPNEAQKSASERSLLLPVGLYHEKNPIEGTKTAPPTLLKSSKKLSVVLPLSNSVQTFFNISKAIVGAGSFALPWCFKNMGLWAASVTILLIAVLSIYTILVLIKCKRYVAQETLSRYLTYVDISRYAFGVAGAVIVYALMEVASLGVCSAYLVFISSTLKSILPHSWALTDTEIMLCILPPIILLTWLRSFKYLSFTSILGVLSLLAGLTATILYGFLYQHIEPLSDYEAFKWHTYPLSFGTVAFLFCVHFLVLPIEESMKEPQKWPLSLSASIAFVTVSNTAFGFLGYLFFGAATCSIVIINLGSNLWVTIVKACLCVDLLFTYAIVFAPGREVVEKSLLSSKSRWLDLKRNLIRTALVLVTFGCAQVQQFGIITNLVGGFSMCTLGLILPPILYIKFYGSTLSRITLLVNALIALFGIVAVIMTSSITIYSLFNHSDPGC